MIRALSILVMLCPLAADAAGWRYDGRTAAQPDPGGPAPSSVAAADEPAAALPGDVPVNNMSMSTVRKRYGEPERIMEAVGEPPITRWQYPGYVVYFERDRVIISVGGRL